MYRKFFGLEEPPFNLTPDPRFLYFSKRHREALAAFVYGVKEAKGFTAITGEIGSGKTTLCRSFLQELDPETTRVALILNSYLSDLELLQTINEELGIESESRSKKDLIRELNTFLLDQNEQGKTTILIIDEAQNLSMEVLEQIRMLSNLETDTRKLIQILLIAQPELNEILARPDLEQLNQRIMVRCHLLPLGRDEIYHYIRHRLHVAGAKLNISITPTALNRIYRYSGGIPRKINLMADRMLLAAFVAGTLQIDAAIVAKAEKELTGMGHHGDKIAGISRTWLSGPFGIASCIMLVVVLLGGCLLAGMHFGKQSTSNNDVSLQAAVPAADLPDLGDLPDKNSILFEDQWVYDQNQIARTSDPDFAHNAALLTVATLWKPVVELKSLRDEKKQDILAVNFLTVFSAPPLNLRYFESTESLGDLVRLDLPLVLEIDDPSNRLSPSVALLHVEGELAVVGDPHLGQVRIGLDTLDKYTRRCFTLYRDAEHLASYVPGDENDALESLRVFLAQQGFWRGSATRLFNTEMEEALKRFQKAQNLEENGRLDGPTAARLSALRQQFRPRLNLIPDLASNAKKKERV